MAQGRFIVYLRVSTARQGQSGLGIEAQRAAVAAFLNGGDWQVCGEYVEIESGKKNDRVELAKAFQACRVYGAKLLIAKLDRLSRDAHFLLGLKSAGVSFTCADMPDANEMTVGIMAVVAEGERKMISARTKAALQAAKARGTQLGGFRVATDGKAGSRPPNAQERASGVDAIKQMADAKAADLLPIIDHIRAAGHSSLRAIAAELSARGIPTSRGAGTWTPTAVSRVLARG